MNKTAERLLKMWPRFLHRCLEVPYDTAMVNRIMRFGSIRRREDLAKKYPRIGAVMRSDTSAEPSDIINVSDKELPQLNEAMMENYGFLMQVEDHEFFMRRLLEHLPKVESFLDVGCGACPYTTFLLGQEYLRGNVVGVDSSLAAAKRAREVMELAGASHELVTALASQLPFEDESFEYVFSNDALHWMKQWRKAVQEMLRVLGSGGRFFINYSTSFPRAGIGRSELERLVAECGGVEVECESYEPEKSYTPRLLIRGKKS